MATTDNSVKADSDFGLEPTELQEMLQAKTLELIQARDENSRLQSEILATKARTLRVYEDNEMMKAAPAIAAKMAEMKFELAMADQFIKSGAFPKGMTAEQAYTVIRAGAEMGMQPLEAMNTLYIVNGAIKPYGQNMVGRLTSRGYKVEYLDESENGVTVRVTTPEGDQTFTEVVRKTDKVLQGSKAMGFSPQNKMRYQGVRMVIAFHVPHVFGSIADLFQDEAIEFDQTQKDARDIAKVEDRKQRQRILDHIEGAKTIEQLEQVRDHIVEYDCIGEYDQKFAALKKLAKAIATPAIEIAPTAE